LIGDLTPIRLRGETMYPTVKIERLPLCQKL